MEETTEENIRQGMTVLATFGRTAAEFAASDDEVNHRDGLWWYEAPIPPRSHKCSTWTHGWVNLSEVRRCACGAIQHNGSDWMERNARRKDEAVEDDLRAATDDLTRSVGAALRLPQMADWLARHPLAASLIAVALIAFFALAIITGWADA